MNTQKKNPTAEDVKPDEEHQDTTVRGSGFTYDENSGPTDQSIPLDKADTQKVIELPDLGKPNRL
jgi:hypothetical protein